MKNIIAIFKRELRSYFDSPIAYIVLVAFLSVAGWMFFSPFFLMGQAEMRTFFAPSPFSPSMLMVILAPALTMRLVAEEQKTGTIELLTTMPVTDAQVIMGKFLAALTLFALALLITSVFAFTVAFLGDLDWGMVISGYVGMLLFASTLIAIGLLCSTLTQNQIVAFIVGFFVCAALYFVYWLQMFTPQGMASVVEYISVSYHLDNLSRGVIDTRDVIYYLTFTAGALFAGIYFLEKKHA